MASTDFDKLQVIINNAEINDAILQQVRKNMTQVTFLLYEVSTLLESGYKPDKKERKPRVERPEGGKRPGRPRKNPNA
ncbi:hypothetical protein [Hymenobacter sp. AT01-02]|uniref:hypothetical protein n=1 Tax=Hymenobacter sp. AT01-02 TaxID=1571877 RepID=UPI0005F20A3C|nr:hypothetical protein [Hymenobacter sp. AT01-02]